MPGFAIAQVVGSSVYECSRVGCYWHDVRHCGSVSDATCVNGVKHV